MSATRDILLSWRHPRQVARRQLGGAVGEERAFGYLVMACILIFIAQWPRLMVTDALPADIPIQVRVGGAMLGWIFLAPLFFYGLATMLRLIAMLFGGKGTWQRARIAVFWSLFAASPFWLLYGLCVAFLPDGIVLAGVGLAALVMTVMMMGGTMIEAERPRDGV